jgi:hypothetical protein
MEYVDGEDLATLLLTQLQIVDAIHLSATASLQRDDAVPVGEKGARDEATM